MDNLFEKKGSLEKYASIKSHLLWGDPDAVKSPSISILIPVYTNSRYFRESLNSALMQDYKGDYEVIICDNTPLDENKTVFQQIIEEVNDHRVLYFRNEQNIGMFPNWNRCFELARAIYVTYCHDDDMLVPHAISTLLALSKHTGRKAIFIPWCQASDEDIHTISTIKASPNTLFHFFKSDVIYDFNLLNHYYNFPGMGGGYLFYRNALLELGGFLEEYYPQGDSSLMIRYTAFYGSVFYQCQLYKYRISNNTSYKVWKDFAPMKKILRAEIAKRIGIPRFINRLFVDSCFIIDRHNHAAQWAPMVKTAPIRWYHAILPRLLHLILRCKKYRFSLR